jgi:hypothetical protein
MSLQTDQAAKTAKRQTAHAVHLANTLTPAVAVVDHNTDPLPTTVPGYAGNAYPSPPF